MLGLKRSAGRRVRYAVVGLQANRPTAALAAFDHVRHNSELIAIVTRDERARRGIAEHYGVPAYSSEMYENLLASGLLDAVYLVGSGARNRDDALAAACHGVHLLSEAPVAETSAAAEEIAAACARQNVLLLTVDRSPFTGQSRVLELFGTGTIGEPKLIEAVCFSVSIPEEACLPRGPSFPSGGFACLSALRTLFRAEPIEVVALGSHGPPGSANERITALLRFPGDHLATLACGAADRATSWCRVIGSRGRLFVESAFCDGGERVYTLENDRTSQRSTMAGRNAVEAAITRFSDCILSAKCPNADGHDAIADLRIAEAIVASLARRKAILLSPAPRRRPEAESELKALAEASVAVL